MKKLLSIVSVILCITTLFVTCAVFSSASDTVTVHSDVELLSALNEPGERNVIVATEITVDSLTVPEGKTLSLIGSEAVLILTGRFENHGMVIIEDTNLDGYDIDVINEDSGVITINGGGYLCGLRENKGNVTVNKGGKLSSVQGSDMKNRGSITITAGDEANGSDAGILINWMGARFFNYPGGSLVMNGNYLLESGWGDGSEVCYFVDEGGQVSGTGRVFAGGATCSDGLKEALTGFFPDCAILRGAPLYTVNELYEALDPSGSYWLSYRVMSDMTINQGIQGFERNLYIDSGVTVTFDGNGVTDMTDPLSVTFGPAFGEGYDFENYGTLFVQNGAQVCLVTYNAESGTVHSMSDSLVEFGDNADGICENRGIIYVNDSAFATTSQGMTLTNKGSINVYEGGILKAYMGSEIKNVSTMGCIELTGEFIICDGGRYINDEGSYFIVDGGKYSRTMYNEDYTSAFTVSMDFSGAAYDNWIPLKELEAGDTVSLPTLEKAGFSFEGWRLSASNGISLITDGIYTLSKEENLSFTAVFRQEGSHIVTVTAYGNGRVSPSGDVQVPDGESLDLLATPVAGYTVDKILLNGERITEDESLTVFDVREDLMIDVYFKLKPCEIHTPGGWVIDIFPTEERDGHRLKICTVCRAGLENETINRLSLWTNPFNDIDSEKWFYTAVRWANACGMIKGMTENEFLPGSDMTRAMLVTLLGRIYGINEEIYPETLPFSDTLTNTWYSAHVAWAAASGTVGGYPDGTFKPDQSITRQEMAVLFCNYAKYNGADITSGLDREKFDSFTDSDSVAGWAEDEMLWLVSKGLINGLPNGNGTYSLNPNGTATRAEVTQMIYNMFGK